MLVHDPCIINCSLQSCNASNDTHGKAFREGSEDSLDHDASFCLYAHIVAHLRGGCMQEMWIVVDAFGDGGSRSRRWSIIVVAAKGDERREKLRLLIINRRLGDDNVNKNPNHKKHKRKKRAAEKKVFMLRQHETRDKFVSLKCCASAVLKCPGNAAGAQRHRAWLCAAIMRNFFYLFLYFRKAHHGGPRTIIFFLCVRWDVCEWRGDIKF